jgi:hypothetical protein
MGPSSIGRHHGHQAAGALNEHAHGRLVAGPLDEVTFPVAGHHPVFHFRRAHVDAHHVGNLSAPVGASCARQARAVAVTQAGDQLAAQLTAWLRIDRRIDGLVRDVQGWIVGPHALERTRDLLGRPLPLQQREHHAPGDALHMQLGRWAGRFTSVRAAHLRGRRCVADGGTGVARQLAAHGRSRAPECAGYGPHTRTLLSHARNRHALFRLELLV